MPAEEPRSHRAFTSSLKQWLHIGGAVAALLATAFVIFQLSEDGRYLAVADELRNRLGLLSGLSVGYALLNSLLCFGWAKVCAACRAPIPMAAAMTLFARTHVYRYLPTNVLHFVGRHAALKSLGTSHVSALLINSMEVGLQIVAAAILAVALWLVMPEPPWQLPAAAGALGLAVPLVLVLAVALASIALARQKLADLPTLTLCLVGYLLFFAGSGVLAAQFSNTEDTLLLVTLVAAIAWLGGALVPGASAGIGIRELLLLSGLAPILGATEALALALGFRLVTVGGDVLLTLVAWLVPGAQASSRNA